MSVRDIHVSAVTDAVKKLCIDANLELEPDMLRAFERALTTRGSPRPGASRTARTRAS